MGEGLDKKREVGLTLLKQIGEAAEDVTAAEYLERLANAYATVVSAMPSDAKSGGIA